MIFQAIAFYVFAAITVASAIMVITSRNAVHSVLFLISAFFNSAGLFILMGAEFLALILVVVYVGAVAVLFLFVVMMLDVDFRELRRGFRRYLPIGLLIGTVLLAELVLVGMAWTEAPRPNGALAGPVAQEGVSNIAALGQVLYTDYVYLFQAAGLILLVAMIGAIVLTLRKREGVKRQDVGRQVGRRREDSVEVLDVETGQGI
jgi:NADH-quinone oxidoreductase subunit J